MRRFYVITRDLHLYAGLFLSPFVLLFSISVFYLVHGWSRESGAPASEARSIADLQVPLELPRLEGRARVEAIRPLLDRIGVSGEVDFIRHAASEHRLIVPVRVPGRETIVDLDYAARRATVTSRRQPLGAAVVYLHKTPGPHNAGIRGNSRFMRFWRIAADGTAYLLLFLTMSGVYLWVGLRAERRIGWLLLAAGAATLFVLAYALTA